MLGFGRPRTGERVADESVHIAADITVDDVLAWNMFHLERMPAVRSARVSGRWVVPALAVCLTGGCGLVTGNVIAPVIASSLAAAWIILYPWFFTWVMRRQLMKVHAKNTSLTGQCTLVADPHALIKRVGEKESRTPWARVLEIVHHRGWVFLYVGEVSAHIIPPQPRVEGDRAAFLSAAQAHFDAFATGGAQD